MYRRSGIGLVAIAVIAMIRIGLLASSYSDSSSSYSYSSSDSYSTYPSSTSSLRYSDYKMSAIEQEDCDVGMKLIAEGNALACVRADGVRSGPYQELSADG